MNEKTKELLKNYSWFDKELKLSDKGIEGLLDLSGFKNKIVNCSGNSITKIINLSNEIKYLDCSNNQISKLIDLPYRLKNLLFSSNPLVTLEYTPNEELTIDDIPETITELVFMENYNQPFNLYLTNIKVLKFSNYFNQECNKYNLPK